MKQRYFLNLEAPISRRHTGTAELLDYCETLQLPTVGREQGNRVGNTYKNDLKSPQSRRNTEAANKMQRTAQDHVPYQGLRGPQFREGSYCADGKSMTVGKEITRGLRDGRDTEL